jgi:hypothetical protein
MRMYVDTYGHKIVPSTLSGIYINIYIYTYIHTYGHKIVPSLLSGIYICFHPFASVSLHQHHYHNKK